MIIINSAPVLSPLGDLIDARNPRIGWHNLVRFDNVFADEEAIGEPVSNIANPATYLGWRGLTSGVQTVQVTLDTAEEVNYFAIAKHNFGSTFAAIQFQYSTDGIAWTDVTEPQIFASDNSIIYEFDEVFASFFRLLITPGYEPPAMSVLYIGQILALQRRIYVGHTPLPYGRTTTISSGRSESGQFLGRVVRREFLESAVDLKNLTPQWYRTYMDPFVVAARTKPFFWAWRPGDYPSETGYAWLTNDVQPSNAQPNGMMQVAFAMQGVP